MTAQINDTVFHRQIQFSIAGISGDGLVQPSSFGFEPQSTSTGCWRGYFANYSVINDTLVLTSLKVGLPLKESLLAKRGKGPMLYGVCPQPDRWGDFRYEGFEHPVPFTGGLLLADGFIRELYVHMGFHPAWKYEQVREIICEKGRLVADHDRSSQMAEVRGRMVEQFKTLDVPSRTGTRDEIREWIEKCFSREYKMNV